MDRNNEGTKNMSNKNTRQCKGMRRECRAPATNEASVYCSLHFQINKARERCEAHECNIACTRGECWRKQPTPIALLDALDKMCQWVQDEGYENALDSMEAEDEIAISNWVAECCEWVQEVQDAVRGMKIATAHFDMDALESLWCDLENLCEELAVPQKLIESVDHFVDLLTDDAIETTITKEGN